MYNLLWHHSEHIDKSTCFSVFISEMFTFTDIKKEREGESKEESENKKKNFSVLF